MHLIMGYGFYKYYYGVRELKYVLFFRIGRDYRRADRTDLSTSHP